MFSSFALALVGLTILGRTDDYGVSLKTVDNTRLQKCLDSWADANTKEYCGAPTGTLSEANLALLWEQLKSKHLVLELTRAQFEAIRKGKIKWFDDNRIV